jgi:hypothetical protein
MHFIDEVSISIVYTLVTRFYLFGVSGELVASDALLDVVRRNSLPHRPEHAALAARAHLKLGIPLSSSLDESLDRSALVSAAADARAALRAGVLTKHSVDSECPDDAACRALLIQCIALDSGFEAAEQALKAMTATGQQVGGYFVYFRMVRMNPSNLFPSPRLPCLHGRF